MIVVARFALAICLVQQGGNQNGGSDFAILADQLILSRLRLIFRHWSILIQNVPHYFVMD